MERVDTLFFDLDGTLTDNYAGIAGCIVYALAQLGRRAPGAATLHACIGPPLRQNFARLLDTTDAVLIERAIDLYRERFEVAGWQENDPYPRIHDALATLAARGFRLIVCTSKPQRYADRIIDHFELRQFFSAVYGPDLAGRLDDKRDLLRHAVAAQGVSAERALMVGDRAQDMRAALGNGMRALGVLYGYGSPEELTGAGAHALCADVAALPEAVDACGGLNTAALS
ncbi:MAG: HAD hydrolase-like protein [Betaproteobacteria bacterium]|nr:HAD hydrolase-like protein [Betaproteobacteria bacterium]